MKLKLLALLLLSVVSFQALAYEGKGFKIVSEKYTHSPGFIGGFEEMSPKKKGSLSVNAMAWAYNAEGRVMSYIKVQGDHNVNISNYTSQVKRYTYTYVLSCEDLYQKIDRTIDINPQGTFTDSSHSYGVVQKEGEGTFGINVSTNVSGSENLFHEASAILRVRS